MKFEFRKIEKYVNGEKKISLVCTGELTPAYLYIDGRKSDSLVGHKFTGITKEFGTCSFLIPVEEVAADSLELASLQEQIQFGSSVDLQKVGLSVNDCSISFFNGATYFKWILKAVNIRLTALDDESMGFFTHEK